jgi:hypothetical protein
MSLSDFEKSKTDSLFILRRLVQYTYFDYIKTGYVPLLSQIYDRTNLYTLVRGLLLTKNKTKCTSYIAWLKDIRVDDQYITEAFTELFDNKNISNATLKNDLLWSALIYENDHTFKLPDSTIEYLKLVL